LSSPTQPKKNIRGMSRITIRLPGIQPFGVGFTGGACSEPKLLQLAYAFEQATKKRTPPPGLR
jgi:Asp-tRNA(Asn)/Glu-tRNA(Gln) amidotransferase A subunit family amidase